MSPRPRHSSECRTRHPSSSSGASTRCTVSSERAPTRLRPASTSQVTRVQPESHRGEQQQPGSRRDSRARHEQRRGRASRRCCPGARVLTASGLCCDRRAQRSKLPTRPRLGTRVSSVPPFLSRSPTARGGCRFVPDSFRKPAAVDAGFSGRSCRRRSHGRPRFSERIRNRRARPSRLAPIDGFDARSGSPHRDLGSLLRSSGRG